MGEVRPETPLRKDCRELSSAMCPPPDLCAAVTECPQSVCLLTALVPLEWCPVRSAILWLCVVEIRWFCGRQVR